MKSVSISETASPDRPAWSGREWAALLICGGLLWGWTGRYLSYHWAANPQYAYGWSAPVLAGLLLWQSWRSRLPADDSGRGRAATLVLAAGLAASLLPTALLLEVTPDWRFAQWLMVALAFGISLAFLAVIGGWRWSGHFAFAFGFIFLAVPWPVVVERAMIGALTEVVTRTTIFGLDLLQIPVERHGNVLTLGSGVLEIEAACSGVRSFQGMLMVALFFGQIRNLDGARRGWLLGIGTLVALGGNMARTLFLAVTTERSGVDVLEKWHDPAGFGILALCFLVVGFVAGNLRPRKPMPRAGWTFALAGPGLWFPAVLAAWLVLSITAVEWWYRSGERAAVPWWRVAWPEERAGFTEVPLTSEARGMRADESRGGRWKEASGSEWTVFFFRWLPGQATSRILARFHSPAVCLPGAGMQLIRESAVKTVRTPGGELSFRTYLFEDRGQPWYVFFCVWEDRHQRGQTTGIPQAWTPHERWQAVLRRERELGQQVLEIGITGAESEAAALAEFERVVPALLQPDPGLQSSALAR